MQVWSSGHWQTRGERSDGYNDEIISRDVQFWGLCNVSFWIFLIAFESFALQHTNTTHTSLSWFSCCYSCWFERSRQHTGSHCTTQQCCTHINEAERKKIHIWLQADFESIIPLCYILLNDIPSWDLHALVWKPPQWRDATLFLHYIAAQL